MTGEQVKELCTRTFKDLYSQIRELEKRVNRCEHRLDNLTTTVRKLQYEAQKDLI